MQYKENRGSEWRKWDLHVHTPASGLNNHFGQTEADWDNYVKTLFTTAISNQVAAIGVTDYFLIDGYKKLRNEYLCNDAKLITIFKDKKIIEQVKQILVVPNIEFRLDSLIDGNRVNYHVLFSDKLSIEDIEDNFLGKINIEISHNTEGVANTMALNKRALERLGQTLKAQQPTFTGSDYEVGCMNAIVQYQSILATLHNPIFKEKYIIVTPVDEDLCNISWDGQGHQLRKLLYQQSNAFFTSNRKTIDFALGKSHTSIHEYLDEFKSLKPCFIGSDAHSLLDITQKLGRWDTNRPDNSKITWIKANATFNGLRQTLYEPETRVSIQSARPEPKNDMHVIDSISFKSDDKTFDTSRRLLFNENLNTIIGGKSSGKSFLICSMAQTINQEVVDRVNRMLELNGYDINAGIDIHWKDGTVDTPKTAEPTHTITYIPQLYINYLAEKKNKEELNGFVLELLCQNPDFLQYYETFQQNVDSINQQLVEYFNRMKVRLNEFQTFKKDVAQIGGLPEAIKKSIETIKQQLKTVTEQSTLSEQEKQQYQQLISQLEEVNQRKQKNKIYLEFLSKLTDLIDNTILSLSGRDTDAENHEYGSIDELFAYYIVGIPQDIENVVCEIQKDLSEKLLYYHGLINGLPYAEEKKQIDQLLLELNTALAPLTKKQDGQKDVVRLQQQLNDLSQKLTTSESLREKINVCVEQYKTNRNNFHTLLLKRKDAYKSLVSKINNRYAIVDSESEISLKANAYIERKDSILYEQINKQRTLSPLFTAIYPQDKELVNFEAIPTFFMSIKSMHDGVITFSDDSTCSVNKDITLLDIFESFIRDDFKLSFEISY